MNEHTFRSELWSKALKEALLDDLLSMRFVKIPQVTPMTMPVVSLPVAVALGAAAAIIKNPVVSRRFLPRRG